jgi:elongation factor G
VTATNALTKKEEALAPDPDGPLAVLVFKTLADPFIGRLTFFRVFSGTLRPDSHIWNATKEREERIGSIMTMRGKSQENATAVPAGDIAAVAKLVLTTTGDSLSARDHPLQLAPMVFPQPVFAAALEARSRTDQDKMGPALQRMQEEDPTIRVHRDAETAQTVISGMGDSHIEMTVERVKRKFGADMRIEPLRVAYRETLRQPAKADGRFVRQTGGHGQYGVCSVELEPLPRGSGYEFSDKIVGGVVSHSFRPAVDKGIQEAMAEGVIAGYPVVDVRATLYDGKEHTVDSSEMAFKIAGSMAFKAAAEKAGVVLLEPVDAGRGTRSRPVHRRHHGRPLHQAGTGQRHEPRGRRDDVHRGRGADVGDAALRDRPALDDPGAGPVHDVLRPLRGGPGNVAQKVVEEAKTRKVGAA